jgi:outer membrane protein TolC
MIGGFAVMCMVAMPAHAKPLTRSGAITRAADENARAASSRSDITHARALKRQADWARWPTLTVDVGVGPSIEADLVPGTAVESEQRRGDIGVGDLSVAFGTQISLIQPLYTFGKISYRRDAADHGIRARQAQTRITQAEVAVEAARLYESVLLARDASLFFEEVDHILSRSIQANRERLAAESPDVSQQDLIRLEAVQSLARIGLHQARAGQRQALAGLRAFLGMRKHEALTLSESGLTPVASESAPFDALVEMARLRRPELVALSEAGAAYGALASAERAAYLPDFFIMGSLSAIHTPRRDDLDSVYVVDRLNHFVPTVLVGARWQLQGGTASARADAERAKATKLHRLKKWALDAMPAEVRKAYEDGERARKDIAEAARARKRTKEWVVRASADNAVGLASSRDLEEAVTAYATLRLAELDAVFRFNIAMAELAKATGTLVDGNSDLYK